MTYYAVFYYVSKQLGQIGYIMSYVYYNLQGFSMATMICFSRLLLLGFAVLCSQSAVANFPLGANTYVIVDVHRQPYAITELAVDVNFTNDTTKCDWSSDWSYDPNISNYYELGEDWVRFNMTELSMYIERRNGTSLQLTCLFPDSEMSLLSLHIGKWEKEYYMQHPLRSYIYRAT